MIELTAEQRAILKKVELIDGGGAGITHDALRKQDSYVIPGLRALTLSPDELIKLNNQICIMEAIAVIQGRGVTDSPPCVSGAITDYMQMWNDDVDDRTRVKLLDPDFIAKLLHTAPTTTVIERKLVERKHWKDGKLVPAMFADVALTVKDIQDPEYRAVEIQREERLPSANFSSRYLTVPQRKAHLAALADLRRWEPEGAACGVPQP